MSSLFLFLQYKVYKQSINPQIKSKKQQILILF